MLQLSTYCHERGDKIRLKGNEFDIDVVFFRQEALVLLFHLQCNVLRIWRLLQVRLSLRYYSSLSLALREYYHWTVIQFNGLVAALCVIEWSGLFVYECLVGLLWVLCWELQLYPVSSVQENLNWQTDKVVFYLFIFLFHLTGKLLNALLSGLSDRSASVRKSYATAIGHLVKVHSEKPSILLTVLYTFLMALVGRIC